MNYRELCIKRAIKVPTGIRFLGNNIISEYDLDKREFGDMLFEFIIKTDIYNFNSILKTEYFEDDLFFTKYDMITDIFYNNERKNLHLSFNVKVGCDYKCLFNLNLTLNNINDNNPIIDVPVGYIRYFPLYELDDRIYEIIEKFRCSNEICHCGYYINDDKVSETEFNLFYELNK